jgi:site-specific recombinase XerD
MFRRYLTVPQQTQLLATVRQQGSLEARRDHGWLRLLRALGLRIGETAKLTCGQARLGLQTNYLLIPASDRKGRRAVAAAGAPPRPDQRQPLTALVTVEAQAALRDLLKVREAQTGERHPPDAAPLILNRYGEALAVRSYQLRMEFWGKAAGITEPISPHWLRHTRAMNIMRLSEAADPRGIVQHVLGHASIASTAIYTGPTKEDVAAALARVDLAVVPLRKRQVARAHAAQLAAAV